MTSDPKLPMADAITAMQQAYIYLHDFHIRLSDTVMEIIEIIGKQSDLDLHFSKAETVSTDHPSFRQNPFDRNNRWVWDWFPLYAVRSFFEAKGPSNTGTLIIEVLFDADSKWEGKDDTSPSLADCDPKHSSLDVYFLFHPEKNQDWRKSWDETDYPDDAETVSKCENGFKCIQFDIDLVTLINRDLIANRAREITMKALKQLNIEKIE
jgi:hypothetical protein